MKLSAAGQRFTHRSTPDDDIGLAGDADADASRAARRTRICIMRAHALRRAAASAGALAGGTLCCCAADRIPTYSAAEVATHGSPHDCWVSMDGRVLDVTKFLDAHPGGARLLLQYAASPSRELPRSSMCELNFPVDAE